MAAEDQRGAARAVMREEHYDVIIGFRVTCLAESTANVKFVRS